MIFLGKQKLPKLTSEEKRFGCFLRSNRINSQTVSYHYLPSVKKATNPVGFPEKF